MRAQDCAVCVWCVCVCGLPGPCRCRPLRPPPSPEAGRGQPTSAAGGLTELRGDVIVMTSAATHTHKRARSLAVPGRPPAGRSTLPACGRSLVPAHGNNVHRRLPQNLHRAPEGCVRAWHHQPCSLAAVSQRHVPPIWIRPTACWLRYGLGIRMCIYLYPLGSADPLVLSRSLSTDVLCL